MADPKFDDSIFDSDLAGAPVQPAESPQSAIAGIAGATPTQPAFDDSIFDEDLGVDSKQDKYGTTEQQLKAGAEGLAEGVAGPLATLAETKLLKVKPEDIRGRKEANPFTHGAAQAAGLIGSSMTGVGEGALLAKLGSKAAGKIAAESALSKVTGAAVSGAIENAAFTGGDEISRMLVDDPTQTLGTALADVGLSALIGGGASGVFASISPLWRATAGDRLGRVIEDFKARGAERIEAPDLGKAVHGELENVYNIVNSTAHPVYGPTGLKAQEISKLVPEVMTPKISEQASELLSKLDGVVQEMKSNPRKFKGLETDLEDQMVELSRGLHDSNGSSSKIFEALQKVKQNLQENSKNAYKYSSFEPEYKYIDRTRSLGHEFKEALENDSVWGKAAERQKSINKSFSEFLPTLKDFEKKFTSEVGGVKQVDPDKVRTYVNGAAKDKGAIKKEMLGNYLEAAEKYSNEISTTHANLGLDSPMIDFSLHHSRGTLGEMSTGAKLADILIEKGLGDVGSKLTAASTGAGIGKIFGHPYLGAIAGEHLFTPFYKSILPAIGKALFKSPTNAAGLKAAIDLGEAAVRNDRLITKAAATVFKFPDAATRAIRTKLSEAAATQSDRDKLERQIAAAEKNPDSIINAGGHVAHYMPDVGAAVGQTAANAMMYLKSLKPDTTPKAPLDKRFKPNPVAQAKYDNALNIAAKPLTVLNKIQKGTLSSDDVVAIKTLYPGLYTNLTRKLMDEVVRSQDKGLVIPYKTKMALSLFLGQPMDSTMTPNALQSIQGGFMRSVAKQSAQQSPAPHSTSKLGKINTSYMTPTQQLQQRHSNRK